MHVPRWAGGGALAYLRVMQEKIDVYSFGVGLFPARPAETGHRCCWGGSSSGSGSYRAAVFFWRARPVYHVMGLHVSPLFACRRAVMYELLTRLMPYGDDANTSLISLEVCTRGVGNKCREIVAIPGDRYRVAVARRCHPAFRGLILT